MRRVRRTWVALLVCCLLAIGVLAGAVLASLTWDGAPDELHLPSEVVVDVAVSEVDDERRVSLAVTLTSTDPFLSNAAGRITGASCEPGQEVSSGEVLGSVDGVPVRLLSTSVPLWRDLRRGDRGADVSALQDELRRLGHSDAASSGTLDQATASAVRRWLAGDDATLWAAYTRGDSNLVLPLSAVVWSPDATVTVRECGLRPGGVIAPGDEVLTPVPAVVSIAVADPLPAPPAGRTRLLTIGDATVPLDDSGAIADEADLATVAATAEFAAWLNSTEERSLTGTVRLDAPVLVGAVPPAAVIGAGTDSVCLVDPDGQVVTVRIVSSRLGQTLVAPVTEGMDLPERVVVDRDGSHTCTSS